MSIQVMMERSKCGGTDQRVGLVQAHRGNRIEHGSGAVG